ncbi:MAG: hypothetical protein IKQ27_01050 [Lachnospiraceae bacterium]|nr:hypothetical protein [Lachnospiraceae bacterium]MBR6155517.1 hypothetical protein [Lachnospiraceae bacterium]
MRNLIKTERYKFTHNIKYWLALIGMFIFGFVSTNGYKKSYNLASLEDLIEVHDLSDFFNAMTSDFVLLIMIVSAVLAYSVGKEFNLRTIDLAVASGHDRKKIVFSKAIVYLIAYNLIMLCYPYGGLVKEFSYYGLGNAKETIFNITRTTLYMILLCSAVFLFAMGIAYIVKSGAKAGGVSICFSFLYLIIIGVSNIIDWANPIYYMRMVLAPDTTIHLPAIFVGTFWIVVSLVLMVKDFGKSELK